ncbi:MAG TPA: tRNA methyl transferase PRC-barrel domain-containing protein, partial [Chitinophagaceae bacterium]|nr:tRNA methyl transferase PRC-barrel domain-containing protein [Chitinophagaceae bacterium]
LEEQVAGGFFVNKEGAILGTHKGYPFYTIGQRKGLDITFGKPAYVTAIDPDTNTVVLGDEEDLEKETMMVAGVNLIKYEKLEVPMEVVTKIRYKDRGALSLIEQKENGFSVNFYEKAKGIAPGQSAVFYEGNDVIGGGIIQREVNWLNS